MKSRKRAQRAINLGLIDYEWKENILNHVCAEIWGLRVIDRQIIGLQTRKNAPKLP